MEPNPLRPVLGAVVLCGGESRRMGRPKAWLPFGPERLLQRVVRLVATVAGPVVVVAAPGQELPPLTGAVTIVRDPVSKRGPLQGLAAGLAALPESVALAYASATDVPFLAPAWIDRLLALIGDHDLAIPFVEGHHHPLAALYRRAVVLPAIEALLERGPAPARLPDGDGADARRHGRGNAPGRPPPGDPPQPECAGRL